MNTIRSGTAAASRHAGQQGGEALLRAFLARHGIADAARVGNIVRGFDLRQPIYVQTLAAGERLQQFIRNADHEGAKEAGTWFALPSATMEGLAIFGGLAGRRAHAWEVIETIEVLEGTAAMLPRDWSWAGGGAGGMTQIFIPRALQGRLRSLGPA